MVHLIDGPGHVNFQFTEGNPFAAIEGTVVTADWLNMVQGEFANILIGAGIGLQKGNNAQIASALGGIIQLSIDLLLARTSTTIAPYDIDDPGIPGVVAGVLKGGTFLATTEYVLSGAAFTGARLGLFAFQRNTAETWSFGSRVYWNDTTKFVTVNSASGLYPVGAVGIGGGTGQNFGWTLLDGVWTEALP